MYMYIYMYVYMAINVYYFKVETSIMTKILPYISTCESFIVIITVIFVHITLTAVHINFLHGDFNTKLYLCIFNKI